MISEEQAALTAAQQRITQLEQALRGAQARIEEIETLLVTEPSDSMCVDHAWWYRRVQEWMKKVSNPMTTKTERPL